MKLRHKKPINSYIGQANHDSSVIWQPTQSAHDEDFEKNHTHCRRQKLVKPKPVTEQTKKYAEILLDFVTVVNQNYRSHLKKTIGQQPPSPRKNPIEPNLALAANLNIFAEPLPHRKTEVGSKQQQKIRISESQSQKLPLPTKKIRKDRPPVEEPPKKRELRELPVERPPSTPQQVKPTPSPNLIDLTATEKPQQVPVPTPKVSAPPQQPQNPYSNPFGAAMNPAMFNPMMLQMAMMSYQNLQQMKPDPSMMPYLAQLQNMFSMMPMAMQGMQNMQGAHPVQQNNYIPFKHLPFFHSDGKNPLAGMSQQMKQFQDSQSQFKKNEAVQSSPLKSDLPPSRRTPATALKPEPPKLRRPQPQIPVNRKNIAIPEIPITNKKEAENLSNPAGEDQRENSIRIEPLPNFNKRASNHVSIAYNIHFHHLREKGIINKNLSQMKGAEDLKVIDPTYPARRIRERKNSEQLPGGNKNQDTNPL